METIKVVTPPRGNGNIRSLLAGFAAAATWDIADAAGVAVAAAGDAAVADGYAAAAAGEAPAATGDAAAADEDAAAAAGEAAAADEDAGAAAGEASTAVFFQEKALNGRNQATTRQLWILLLRLGSLRKKANKHCFPQRVYQLKI